MKPAAQRAVGARSAVRLLDVSFGTAILRCGQPAVPKRNRASARGHVWSWSDTARLTFQSAALVEETESRCPLLSQPASSFIGVGKRDIK